MSDKSDTVEDVVGADQVVAEDDQSATADIPASLTSTKDHEEHSSSKIDGHLPTNDLDRAPPLNSKEQKALKRAKYEERQGSFTKEFLLEHKKSGRMVEIKGATSLQACSFIGWRPRHCKVVSETEVDRED